MDCCGNKFCRTCIKRVEDDNRPCPLCNVAFTSVPDRQLERQLNERKVYCKNTDKGCNWIGELRQLKQHLNPGARLNSVQEICDFQEIQCLRCQQYVERKKLNIPCQHLPSQPCPYKYVGCTFNKPKPELEAHLQQNVTYHATLAARKTEALDADIKMNLQTIKQLSQILREELQASYLRTQIHRIIQGMVGILLVTLLVFVAVNYWQNKAGHLRPVQNFEKEVLELKEKIALLSMAPGKDELAEIRRKNVNIETSIRNLEEKLTRSGKALEDSTHSNSDDITKLSVIDKLNAAETDAFDAAGWVLIRACKLIPFVLPHLVIA